MKLSRRQFLTLVGGSTAGAVVFAACGVPERELLIQSPSDIPEDLVLGTDNWFATVCRHCPTSEGVVIRVMEGRAKKVEGNVDYPINRGKHTARCEAGLQSLYHPDRISAPMLRTGERGAGGWEEISWADAMGRVRYQLELLRQSGNQEQMVMVTNPIGSHLGQVVNQFVTSYGGRRVPYEPLERTALQEAVRRVFNQEVMPDFDIENANFILSFGADFLSTWVSPTRYARGYGVFRQGERERGTLYHVDSRLSMTASNADRWIYVRPGWEGILALSIAQVIIAEGLGDQNAARALTGNGAFDLNRFAPEQVAGSERTGVSAERIREVAREFAAHRPAVALGGGSSAAHTNGLFNLVAIYSLNYLVGSVGQPGGVIFNPRPPLNGVPVSPATASYGQWQEIINDMRQGRVRVMMTHGADPWYGLPLASGFRSAFFNVPFIFSFSEFLDDTTFMSDLVLPTHDSLEDWGSDIPDPAPGYQVVGFQQPVVRPFLESKGPFLGSRGFGDTLLNLAGALGLNLGLPATFKEVVQAGAQQLFEMNRGSVQAPTFRQFWNGVLQRGGWWDTSARSTDAAPTPPQLPDIAPPAFDSTSVSSYPFHLIPFASNSMGDGGGANLPWLQATPDPVTTATWQTWVEINRRVAEERGIVEGDIIRVSSAHGSILALAFPHPGMPPDAVAIPIGQGHRAFGRYAENRGANVFNLLAPEMKDSETGALAWAATRVRISKTGSWMRLPKLENTVPDPPTDEEQHLVKVTPTDT